LELLSAVFGLDVLTYAILSNHLHVILRIRPDVVEEWSNWDVATRWLKLYPGKRLDEHLGEPTQEQIAKLVSNQEKLNQVRRRLSDVSWFMRALAEPIARMANREDGCKGRFWEGRFKAQKIVDEAGLLACAMYVDLNPVRAAMAATPEQSRYTSAFDRIEAFQGKEKIAAALEIPSSNFHQDTLRGGLKSAQTSGEQTLIHQTQRDLDELANRRTDCDIASCKIARDGWLAPLELDERGPLGSQVSQSRIRASDKGFLSMKLTDYLKLLDWTGQQKQTDKCGKIPNGLAPILDRLGIESSMWRDLVWNYRKYFGRSRACGHPKHLRAEADRQHKRYLHGQHLSAACFA
jgi:REP element-mobilizing transposase RayT